MRNKDYQAAFEQYRNAADRIPNAPNTARLYNHAIHGVCESGCLLAEQRIAEGRFGDADAILRKVVADYDPKCGRAITILKRMEDPDYYNKTIGPKFRARVEEVKQLFVEAHGFYDSGRYDLAYKRCEQILNLDPYNIAARKFEEQVNKKERGLRDRRLQPVALLCPLAGDQGVGSPGAPLQRGHRTRSINDRSTEGSQTQAIQRKLNTIIIPKLEFREASIREAIDFLKQKSVQLDTDPDPTRRGVNIVLRLDQGDGGAGAAPAAPAAGGARRHSRFGRPGRARARRPRPPFPRSIRTRPASPSRSTTSRSAKRCATSPISPASSTRSSSTPFRSSRSPRRSTPW